MLVAAIGSAFVWFPFPATALLMAAWAFGSQGYFDLDEIMAWETLYVLIFTSPWYVFGDQWETISSITCDVTSIFMLLTVFATILSLALRYKKRGATLRGA